MRTPTLRDRLFTPTEAELPAESLAARFAAKEALAKALGAPAGLSWQDAEVVVSAAGQPSFALSGTVAARAADLGVESVAPVPVARRRLRARLRRPGVVCLRTRYAASWGTRLVSPRARRSVTTVSGSSRSSRALHRTMSRPGVLRRRCRARSSSQCSTSMWKPPSISSTSTRAVGQHPLAVEVAPPATAVASPALSARRRKVEPTAQPAEVDLCQRLRAALDVAQHRPEQRGPTERAHQSELGEQQGRCGQPLLHHRREKSLGRPRRTVVPGEEQGRRFDPRQGQLRPDVTEPAERTTCPDEADPVEVVDDLFVVDEHRDHVAVPVAEPVHLQCAETAHQCLPTGVQGPQPHGRLTTDVTGERADHGARACRPPRGGDLVAHPVGVAPERTKLATGDHASLGRGQPGDDCQVEGGALCGRAVHARQGASDRRRPRSSDPQLSGRVSRTRPSASWGTRPLTWGA